MMHLQTGSVGWAKGGTAGHVAAADGGGDDGCGDDVGEG